MPTYKLRLTLASGLMLFLTNCTPVPTEPARPVAEGVTELAKTLCDIWRKSQPTWVDEDTPRTIDEIDYGYRVQEATCAPITGEPTE